MAASYLFLTFVVYAINVYHIELMAHIMVTLVVGQIQSFAPNVYLFNQTVGPCSIQIRKQMEAKRRRRRRRAADLSLWVRSTFAIYKVRGAASSSVYWAENKRWNVADDVKSQTAQLVYCMYKSL